jgi:hypothetical protein
MGRGTGTGTAPRANGAAVRPDLGLADLPTCGQAGAAAGPICFTPGTLIATPKGERQVETLRPGDRVITRDNGIQEIRWTGMRTLDRADLAQNPHFRPILLTKDCLGAGLPERDMVVSPLHRLLVDRTRGDGQTAPGEVLVPACHLVDNHRIRTLETLRTTYIHFLCDRHELVLSNGSWSESFQPVQAAMDGLSGAARHEIEALFPDLGAEAGQDAFASVRPSLGAEEAGQIRLRA